MIVHLPKSTEVPTGITAAGLNSLSREQTISVLGGQFGKCLIEWAANHVSPFWWIRQSPLGPMVCNNGSSFFLEIDDRLFAVTASHVYSGFLRGKEISGRNIKCKIGNLDFDPIARLRGHSVGVDIVTFDISKEELEVIGKQAIVSTSALWPPPHPFTGQTAMVAGFPGEGRLWLNQQSISFGLYIGRQPVGTASDHSITCPLEREHWIEVGGLRSMPEGSDLGGISGGPLLLPMEANGVWSLSLGGVISEAPAGLIETIVSVPSHFIGRDGGVLDRRSAPVKFAVRASES